MSQHRRSESAGSRVIRILVVVLAILVAIAAGLYAFIHHKLNAINRISSAEIILPDDSIVQDDLSGPEMDWTQAELVTHKDGVANILLVGQDARDKSRQRSDSMILISVNTNSNQLTMVSFMRDLYVQIPGHNASKLNYAYQLGGFELLDQTLAENFGVTIDYNIEVDFGGFKDIVDSLGGVEVELDDDEVEYMAGRGGNYENGVVGRYTYGRTYDLQVGWNLLDGRAALDFARARHVGNFDYERTQRQRQVIKAIYKKVKDVNWFKLIGVYDSVAKSITTDMNNAQILSLAFSAYAMGIDTDELNSYRIPANGMYTESDIAGSVLLVNDWDETRTLLKDYLYSEDGGKAAYAALVDKYGFQYNMK